MTWCAFGAAACAVYVCVGWWAPLVGVLGTKRPPRGGTSASAHTAPGLACDCSRPAQLLLLGMYSRSVHKHSLDCGLQGGLEGIRELHVCHHCAPAARRGGQPLHWPRAACWCCRLNLHAQLHPLAAVRGPCRAELPPFLLHSWMIVPEPTSYYRLSPSGSWIWTAFRCVWGFVGRAVLGVPGELRVRNNSRYQQASRRDALEVQRE